MLLENLELLSVAGARSSRGFRLRRWAQSRHRRVLQAAWKSLDFTTRRWEVPERFNLLRSALRVCVSPKEDLCLHSSQKYWDMIPSVAPPSPPSISASGTAASEPLSLASKSLTWLFIDLVLILQETFLDKEIPGAALWVNSSGLISKLVFSL